MSVRFDDRILYGPHDRFTAHRIRQKNFRSIKLIVVVTNDHRRDDHLWTIYDRVVDDV